jgi:hypothetical protein
MDQSPAHTRSIVTKFQLCTGADKEFAIMKYLTLCMSQRQRAARTLH